MATMPLSDCRCHVLAKEQSIRPYLANRIPEYKSRVFGPARASQVPLLRNLLVVSTAISVDRAFHSHRWFGSTWPSMASKMPISPNLRLRPSSARRPSTPSTRQQSWDPRLNQTHPLHACSSHGLARLCDPGHHLMVRELLRFGVDREVTTSRGRTAYDLAAEADKLGSHRTVARLVAWDEEDG